MYNTWEIDPVYFYIYSFGISIFSAINNLLNDWYSLLRKWKRTGTLINSRETLIFEINNQTPQLGTFKRP